MSEKPSRWHKWSNRTIWKNNHAVGSEPGWVLICTNHDTPTTSVVKIDSIHYCVYCANKAISIQGNYDEYIKQPERYDSSWGYVTTGYTCDCAGARSEREYLYEKYALESESKRKLQSELKELLNHYSPNMVISKNKLLEIRARSDAKMVFTKIFNLKSGQYEKD